MVNTKLITAAGGLVAVAGLSVGAAAYANANAAAPVASTTYSTAGGSQSTKGGVGSNDTPVTGTELANVTAAVTAKDSTVTVTEVRKDPDGSYDVIGTKAGAQVRLEVSADLKTITTAAAGGKGRGHGANDTPVTGTELANVTAAVTAKDSTVTVTEVRKDPDGSYDVIGTKAGAQVRLEVSADLKTITANTSGDK